MQIGKMNIQRKLLLIMISGVFLCAFLGASFIYGIVQDEIILNETIKLQKLTTRFTTTASRRFLESSPKLEHLAHLLEKQLSLPIKQEEIQSYYALMEKNAAGVWHNRRDLFNAEYDTGIFLPPNAKDSDQQKVMHLRIKQLFDVVGGVASKRLENVWYLSPFRSEMMFDRNYPDYIFNEKDDADYTQTPWVTYTSPLLNPNRELRFTPPLFDPANGMWMVSAVYPLYVKGEWMGSIGEDMQLSDVLGFMFMEEQIYNNTQHFLIDDQGNFVLAGDWQNTIEANNKPTKLNFESEPELASLFQQQVNDEPQVLSTELWIQNKRYVAIAMTIYPVNWRYFRIVPVNDMMATTRELFIHLLEMIVLIGFLNALFTFFIAGKNITNRIKILANAMTVYAKTHQGRLGNKLSGNDEISQLGLVFDGMANEIDQNIESLNHRNQLLQSVFDISQSGYLLFDTQKRVLLANNTLATILGFSVDVLLNMTASEFWDRLAKQTKFSLLPPDKNTAFFRIDLLKPQHTNLLCKMSDIVLPDGESLGTLYLFHDISKEEESNRIKNEFLVHATHELRTPLTTIHGYTELLSYNLIPVETQPEAIAIILEQSTWLMSIINELLDLSRIEARDGVGYEIRPYLINDLILQALTEFQIPHGRDEITLAPVLSNTSINVDKVKFKQVIHNILDNAFKYSPKGGDIFLTVHEYDQIVEIKISDQGIGIGPENIDKVFERFFRVDKSGNIPGIGLGLTIAKEVMQFFNGDIHIISTPNQGSSVILRFNI
jgi:signal transduction histidine kinase